jgi:hypothetical protein
MAEASPKCPEPAGMAFSGGTTGEWQPDHDHDALKSAMAASGKPLEHYTVPK